MKYSSLPGTAFCSVYGDNHIPRFQKVKELKKFNKRDLGPGERDWDIAVGDVV